MEPISTIIVTALAAGAAAGLTDTAAQAVKDAYAGLKNLIKSKYVKASAGVDILETDPSSEDLQAFAGKQLASTGAADDPDIQKLAQALLDAVAQHAPESARTIGVDLKDIQAGSLRLADIKVQAAGTATGVSASGINVAGDFVIQGVSVTSGVPPAAPARPAAAPKIKILFLAANPTDTARLRLGDEVRAIDQSLQLARYRDAFDLEQAHAVRVGDLQGPAAALPAAHRAFQRARLDGRTDHISRRCRAGLCRPAARRWPTSLSFSRTTSAAWCSTPAFRCRRPRHCRSTSIVWLACRPRLAIKTRVPSRPRSTRPWPTGVASGRRSIWGETALILTA
ncbi:MAG: hypothetical protein H6647_20065 [Anaerolineales bacterium]|nr:hypothetical protein [Anaerolineales bacterium]